MPDKNGFSDVFVGAGAGIVYDSKSEKVMHIVSDVYGKCARELNLFDVLASIFPAGTLSGAPKIRAMQIINKLRR